MPCRPRSHPRSGVALLCALTTVIACGPGGTTQPPPSQTARGQLPPPPGHVEPNACAATTRLLAATERIPAAARAIVQQPEAPLTLLTVEVLGATSTEPGTLHHCVPGERLEVLVPFANYSGRVGEILTLRLQLMGSTDGTHWWGRPQPGETR